MPEDVFPDELDAGQTIRIPRFGIGQKIFRRYTLQKILGQGGMGVVWLAHDEQLQLLVALKVLPEALGYDDASLDALKRETKLGLNLAHPNIVRIYDFQQDESGAAISMEYVDGPTLSDLRVTKPNKVFSEGELLRYIEPLCDALHYAHTREMIVHRDLKPRNLMLNSEDELKVTDFGISKSISESVTMLTGNVGSSGSPPYISPQQWDGERPTALDDIYSVGATFYELLSSRPPLLGVVDWQKVHQKKPPPISERRLELGINNVEPVSVQWEETIAACLAKDSKDRPQTIRDLQSRLTANPRPAEITLKPSTEAPPNTDTTPTEIDLDFGGDTIVGRTAFLPPKAEPPPIPTAEVDLGGAKPVLELPPNKPQPTVEVSKDSGQASTRSQSPAASETKTFAKAPVASAPDVAKSADPIAVDPPLEVAKTSRDVAVPSLDEEPPIHSDTAVSPSKGIPMWVWLAAAAILLLGSLFFIFKEPSVPSVAKGPSLGDLVIESEPVGAVVTLDQGQPMNAPHIFREVPFGTHRLTVTKEGYLPIEQELRFAGEGVPKIVLQPEPKPPEEIGKLSIRSDPPGALIRLDGAIPQEPDTFTDVKFGEHHLTAALDGFESQEESLAVSGEMNTDIVLKLKPVEPTSTQDPLQALVDERKEYETARDWPKYRDVSLQLVRQLTVEGAPISNERRELLGSVIEGLRTKGPALSPEEFRAYEKNLKYAAKLDLVPAILVVADNLRLRDSTEAFDWYSYAAETKRVPYAMTKIAWLYWRGECGRHADKGEGLRWFKLAQAAGDTGAGVIVGKCYLRGDGIAKDENAGIQILLPLAEAGVAAAKTLIGQCYYAGCGQFAALPQKERDRRAKGFYEEAIAAGDWEACGHLGVMYEVGQGVPMDWKQAAKLYLQGVDHENPICMYYYAQAIETHGAELMKLLGREDKAETYYIRAAAASVTQAKEWCIKHNVQF